MFGRLGLGVGLIPTSARPVPTTAPLNVVAPSITGILTQGQTLTANPGSWTGLPSGAYAYRWQRSGVDIGGATSVTYVATATDVSAGASALTVEVDATNTIGTTTAESAGVTIAATLAITGAPGAPSVGAAYTFTPASTGGHTPKTFALTGTLPAGLSFNTSTGAITGTPTTSGTASGLNITVTDTNGLTAALGTFSLVVSSAAVAAVDTFEINGVTALDPKTYLAAPYGIDGNGWTAHLVATDTGTGTPPDATKVLVYVGMPGWKNKVAVTRWFALRGKTLLPKSATSSTFVHDPLYNDPAPAGGKRGWHVVLHMDPAGTAALAAMGREILPWGDQVYVTTTNLEVTLEAGWYAAAAAGSVAGAVVNSTVAVPPVEVHPLDFEREYFNSGSTHTCRFKVSHAFGKDGRMFDAAEIHGIDGSSTSGAVTTVSDVALSSVVQNGIYSTICSDSYSTSGLSDSLCRDRIKVWPLVGDVYDSESYIADPNDMRSSVYWRKDNGGTYKRPYAVVESGAAGPGVASFTLATAEASPFPSWHLAQIALAGNVDGLGTRGHTGGGVIYGRNLTGGDITLDKTGAMTGVIGDTCMYIKQHPSNTAKLIFGMGSASHTLPTRVIWDGTEITRASTSAAFGVGQAQSGNETAVFQFRNAPVHMNYASGSSFWNGNWPRSLFENISWDTTSTPDASTFGPGINGSNSYFCKVLHGARNNTLVAMIVVPYTLLGFSGKVDLRTKGTGQPVNAGLIAHSVRMEKSNVSITQFVGVSSNGAVWTGRGAHLEQFANDFKTTSKDFSIGGDSTVAPMENVNVSYMQNPPNPANVNDTTGRNNVAYGDVDAAHGIAKHLRERMCHDGRWAIKTAWFNIGSGGSGGSAGQPGNVANWRTWGMVGWGYNTMSFGRDPGLAPSIAGTGAQPEWAGMFRAVGSKYSQGIPPLTTNLTVDGTDTPSNLQPTGTLEADNFMFVDLPAGWQLNKYDIKGATRRDAGNFPSNGPYERL